MAKRRGPTNGVLPHDDASERTLVGGLLVAPDKLAEMRLLVRSRDFFNPVHAFLFDVLVETQRKGHPIEMGTITAELRTRTDAGMLKAHGGEAYLGDLAAGVVTVENLSWHAKRVREFAEIRRWGETAQGIADAAVQGAEPEEFFSLSRRALGDLDLPRGDGKEGFPVVTIGSIPDPGPVRWLIKDLWTEGAFGFIGAEPKAYKSWLTWYMALCVASGLDVFNRFPVEQGRVLVYSAEGGTRLLRRRLSMMARAFDVDLAHLDLHVITVPVMRLDEPAQTEMLVRTVEKLKPRLLVLDPLRELHAADENDAAAIVSILTPLRTLQRTTGTACQVVHHMRKAPSDGKQVARQGQRLRGSSALHGASDSALYLDAKGEGAEKRVTVRAEHREADEIEPFTFKLKFQALADGDAVWPEIVDESEVSAENEVKQTENATRSLEMMKRKVIAAVSTSMDPLPTKTAIYARTKGNKSQCLSAIKELADSGVITFENGFRIRLDAPNRPSFEEEERA